MDKPQQEIQFYGILMESLTIILTWKKLFAQITIATIFPLSLLFLGHVQISELLVSEILHNHEEGSFKNPKMTPDSLPFAFWSFKIAYVIFYLALSLVSTSAVVHTAACVYTRKEIGFAEVMSVVPKVWKRVLVTFAWSLIIVLVYNMAWFGFSHGCSTGRVAIKGPLLAVYMIGFVYASIIWHLASVVSVVEEDCGIEAMIKGRRLVKGRMVISGAIFLFLNLCFILTEMVFMRFVVLGELFWSRIMCGILCLVFLCGFTLLGLVTQTVVYLVCKMYHYGIMEKSLLGNEVEGYLGDYAPMRSRDVLLDQC